MANWFTKPPETSENNSQPNAPEAAESPPLVQEAASVEGEQVAFGKTLEPIAVPFVSVWSPVLVDPVQIQIDNGDRRGRRQRLLQLDAGGGHQLVVEAKRLRLVGTELDLLAVDFDVPASARFLVERLREVSHGANPPIESRNGNIRGNRKVRVKN